jgi:tRNA(Ile)-lysidine synthase
MSNQTLHFTADHLLCTLQTFPTANKYLVGYSGGADSTALLHALSSIRALLDVPIEAVHVNHGLHKDADHWQTHCERFCSKYKIILHCLSVHVATNTGKGTEAEARKQRYRSISELLQPGESLLTAHHADDQAETILLNLMRGSGVDGLSAMPKFRNMGRGMLQRPLLEFRNQELITYLSCHGLDWIEDPSNQKPDHDRNFLRHEVIPLLETHWPNVSKRLILTNKAMRGARAVLEKTARDYLDNNLMHPLIMQVSERACKEPALFNLVIRSWLNRSGAPPITANSLDSLVKQFLESHPGQHPVIGWDGWQLRLFKDQLWLLDDSAISPCPVITFPDDSDEVELNRDCGRFLLKGNRQTGYTGRIIVCNRQGNEGSKIKYRGLHRTLKNLFQSGSIPAWLRDSIPLCKIDDELVAVGDWCINEEFATWLTENGISLRWRPQNPLLRYIRDRQHDGFDTINS